MRRKQTVSTSATGRWEPQVIVLHVRVPRPGAVFLFCKAFEILGEEQWLQMAKESGTCIWTMLCS